MRPTTDRFLPSILRTACCSLLTVLLAAPAVDAAPDDAAKEAYQAAWDDVADLLKRREYSSALAELDELVEERELQAVGRQITADRKAIAGLQTLERIVHEQAEKLRSGAAFEVTGIQYTVVRPESSTKGDALVLKSKSTGKDTTILIVDLPASAWLHLLQYREDEVPQRPLTLGIFLTFDRTPDTKAARKLLNEAAESGEDVTAWLARLERREAAKKEATGDRKDPIIGHWLLQMEMKDFDNEFNVEFRSSGTVTSSMTARTRGRIHRMHPRSKRPLALTGKWNKGENGVYTATFSGGSTWELIFTDEDHLTGKRLGGTSLNAVRKIKD